MADPALIPERNWLNIQWLARLRWAEIAGQASTVLVAQFLLGGRLPMLSLFAVIGVGLVTNLVLEMYFFGDRRRGTLPQRTVHEWHLASIMTIDIAILTGLLYLTGGANNPFSFLYLVQIALAAVVVRARWTWMLVALSFAGFGVLLTSHQPLVIPPGSHEYGAWVALGVASAFVVHFLLRITSALAERDRELTLARGLAARQERLASLATMAAGAAHEPDSRDATPPARPALVDLAADARLIREQVGRCRVILDQMAQGAGTVGESVTRCTVRALLDETLIGVRPGPRVHCEFSDEIAATILRLPPRAVSQALRSLVTNAQDASPPDTAVVVSVRQVLASGEDGGDRRELIEVGIRDRGPGMAAEVLARIGEPFFTTKPPGRGMGLGLFLARAVLEGIGGSLRIDSNPEHGTAVQVRLPIDVGVRSSDADLPPARAG